MPSKHPYLIPFIKIAVSIALLGILYYQISGRLDQIDFDTIKSNQVHWFWLIFTLALLPLNWFFEALKYRLLLKSEVFISIRTSIKCILSGISIGIITPARVGEYGGRLLYIQAHHRAHALLSTLVSSIAQNIINVSLGFIGVLLFCRYYSDIIELSGTLFLSITISMILILVLAYFNLTMINRLVLVFPTSRLKTRMLNVFSSLKQFSSRVLIENLAYSFLRYLVYLLQYVGIIFFFGFDINVVESTIGVSVIFLIQSGLPLPMLLSVLARGQIAILIWSVFDINVVLILAATLLLWIINLVLPAVIGLFFVNKASV